MHFFQRSRICWYHLANAKFCKQVYQNYSSYEVSQEKVRKDLKFYKLNAQLLSLNK